MLQITSETFLGSGGKSETLLLSSSGGGGCQCVCGWVWRFRKLQKRNSQALMSSPHFPLLSPESPGHHPNKNRAEWSLSLTARGQREHSLSQGGTDIINRGSIRPGRLWDARQTSEPFAAILLSLSQCQHSCDRGIKTNRGVLQRQMQPH